MSKRTHLLRSLLLLPGLGLVGCGVAPHAHAPRASQSALQVRSMSNSTKAAIGAQSSSASDALSRMDAYRARAAAAQ
jgi:hypothetical protein